MADTSSRASARYATPEILRFVQDVHAPHDAPLAQAFTAPESHGMPAIQVAPAEGKLLEILAALAPRTSAAGKRAVEIGTLAGFSAIHLARGLGADGRLWTFEFDPKHARVARDNIAAAGLADRVEVIEGTALERLSSIEAQGPFDLVFVDADKRSYDAYGRWAQANLARGGLLIGDNAYLFGRLLEPSEDADTMRRFHRETAQKMNSTCIPTPDGLLLAIQP